MKPVAWGHEHNGAITSCVPDGAQELLSDFNVPLYRYDDIERLRALIDEIKYFVPSGLFRDRIDAVLEKLDG